MDKIAYESLKKFRTTDLAPVDGSFTCSGCGKPVTCVKGEKTMHLDCELKASRKLLRKI